MAQVKRYANNAERQRAHRERLLNEQAEMRGMVDAARSLCAALRNCERAGVQLDYYIGNDPDYDTLASLARLYQGKADAQLRANQNSESGKAQEVRKASKPRKRSTRQLDGEKDHSREQVGGTLRGVRKGKHLADIPATASPTTGA